MAASPDLIAATWRRPPSLREGLRAGRALRKTVPRTALARLDTGDRDPLGVLDEQNATRVADLIPVRVERMRASPFAFYRGSAAIQAADLGRLPHSGILIPSCGDAHVANFGLYASPMRTLLFDINDFDEAAWAPWEWDVKRLVTSILISGRTSSRDDAVIRDAAVRAVRTYARVLSRLVARGPLERYYEHFDPVRAIARMDAESRAAFTEAMRDAQRRTGERAARKLTQRGADGRLRFIEEPPTMSHGLPQIEGLIADAIADYEEHASVDIRTLLSHFVPADIARRVVGVGSVGTRCYVIVFEDGDRNALLLQVKQANRSVLEQYGGMPQPRLLEDVIAEDGEGARVVAMQRTLQALSDPMLGHLRGLDGDYYVRQFRDMKGGVDTEVLDDAPFVQYAIVCAATLARAHGQSPAAVTVAGYIGNGRLLGDAILEWATAYAALADADYRSFLAAHPAAASG